MGRKVNVVLPNGKTVSVDEETYNKLEGSKAVTRQSVEAEDTSRVQAAHDEKYSGAGATLKAGLLGAADTLTFGGASVAAGVVGGEDFRNDLVESAKAHPVAHMVGTVAGGLLPVGAPGAAMAAGKAGKAIGGAAVGRAIEGGIIGAGSHIATTNVTGDPLTIEGMLVGVGTGAVLNVGFGAAADKVKTWGQKAGTVVDEAKVVRDDIATVKEGRELFNKPRESWDGFKESIKSVDADASKVINAEAKAAKDYGVWTSPDTAPKKIDGAIRQAEKARNELQTRLSKTKYGKAITETGEAFDGATAQADKLKGKADDLLGSTEDWPKLVKSVDDAIAEVRGRWAPKGADEPLFKTKLEGYTGSFDERGAFDKGESFLSAKKKMPISEETDKLLTEYSARASDIRKMKTGGFKLKKNRWVKDDSVKPDPDGALKELHKLRADFSKKYSGVEFPDLPAPASSVEAPLGVTARGAEGAAGQMDEVRQLSQASRELTDGIAQARAKFKAGDYEAAAEELRMLKDRAAAAGQNDLVLPSIPRKAAPVEVLPAVRAPKTLLEFANMEPPTVERLANLMKQDADGRIAKEFERLAREFDIDPTDGLAGLHAKLGKYTGADKRLIAMARKEAEDEAGGGFLAVLRRGAKKFVRYGAARAADSALGGRWMGALGRVGAGEGVNAAMNITEDLVSGSMMQARLGIKDALAGLINKSAPMTSAGLNKLGPISAYLSSHLLTGEPDGDASDLGAGAVKRVSDAIMARSTAPDAAFVAVQALLGHPSDAAAKMSQKIVGDYDYLMQMAPKDPGIAMHGLKSDWQPNPEEALEFAYRIEAVTHPLKAIERTIAGDGHPAAVEALWARWPALMQTAAGEFAYALHDKGDMSLEEATNYSSLFRTPITGLADPAITLELQGMYLPKPEEGSGSSPQASSSGKPVGRPAAIQNSVAGSSVSGLLSQTA